MDPRVHSPTLNHTPTFVPEEVSDPPPIPDFTSSLDIQHNPFFCFTTPADFSSDDDDDDLDDDKED